MDDDWDLHAVVRGCSPAFTTTTTTPAATNDKPFPSFSFHDDQTSFDFPDFAGLREVYQDFCGDDPTPPANADIAATDTNSIPAAHFFQSHQQIVQIKPSPQMNMQIQENNIQFNNPPRLGSSSSHNFPAANAQPIRPRRRLYAFSFLFLYLYYLFFFKIRQYRLIVI